MYTVTVNATFGEGFDRLDRIIIMMSGVIIHQVLGVSLTLSLAWMSAPDLSNNSEIQKRRFPAAVCNGVEPHYKGWMKFIKTHLYDGFKGQERVMVICIS